MKITKYAKGIKNSSLQKRITFSFVFLMCIILLFVTIIAFNISSNIIVEQTKLTMDQSMALVIEKIDFMRNELKTYSKITIADDEIQNYINNPDLDYNQMKHLERLLISTLEPRTFIDAAIIYSSYGKIFVPTSIKLIEPLPKEVILNINERVNTGENAFCSNTREEYYYRDNRNRQIISFYYEMNSSYTSKRLGILELSITEEFIYNLYKSVKIGETGQIFIVNSLGSVISSQDKKLINTDITSEPRFDGVFNFKQETSILKIHGIETLIMIRSYPQLNWYVIGTVPIDEITEKSKLQSLIIIFSGFFFSLIAVFIIARISKSVSNPIITLYKLVQQTIPGDTKILDDFDLEKCSFEVGILAEEFKELNLKTYNLMEGIKEANRLEKEHDLHRLQIQMNPHFLYNTLETICGLIDLEHNNQAVELVNMVAAFYRGILNKGQIIVKISEDINIVRCYLDIINVRYNNRLKYEIDIDDEVLNQSIIKLTIQPLIENALVHGLLGKQDEWVISIRGYIENNTTYICVKDNGIGMTKMKFDEALSTKEKIGGGSFALYGTDERIKLHFGKEYGLEFIEGTNLGTQIKINLPYCR